MVICDRTADTMGESFKKENIHTAYMEEAGYESSDDSVSSVSSCASDVTDDPTSCSCSSSSSSCSYHSQADSNSSSPHQRTPPIIKRGLSKFYQGKSESFTSLSDVTSIEDLAKKENPYKRKMKASKSYAGMLEDLQGMVDNICSAPAKKSPRNSFDSLANHRRCSNRMDYFSTKLPPVPLKKN